MVIVYQEDKRQPLLSCSGLSLSSSSEVWKPAFKSLTLTDGLRGEADTGFIINSIYYVLYSVVNIINRIYIYYNYVLYSIVNIINPIFRPAPMNFIWIFQLKVDTIRL